MRGRNAAPEAQGKAAPVFMPKRKREAENGTQANENAASRTQQKQQQQQRSRRDRSKDAVFREKPPKAAEKMTLAASAGKNDGTGVLDEGDMDTIRRQHLGSTEEKRRKVLKPSDRMRFHFEWDDSEDTSQDHNPLYSKPHEPSLLFGRGRRAGFDPREQRKEGKKQEEYMRKKLEETHGKDNLASSAAQSAHQHHAMSAPKPSAPLDNLSKAERVVDEEERTHWSEKPLEGMTERDWRIFKEDFNIQTTGGKMPHPLRSWEESELPTKLKRAVQKAGYNEPTPIQRAAVPIGLKQRDVIGIAETGSGKTCAFVLPMLAYIMQQPPLTDERIADGPYALVLAPTRELALQIDSEARKFANELNYTVVPIVGGQPIDEQGFALRQGCEIVVGTPGRMLDCLNNRYTVLHQCNYVVLDEADRMIDLGFEPQVVGILEAMPSSNLKPTDSEGIDFRTGQVYRTTYMFSATMPPAVERIARNYMRNPATVNIGRAGKVADTVTQDVRMLERSSEKWPMLERVLQEYERTQAIVFCNSRAAVENIARSLEKHGQPSTMLHGQKSQEQREASLEAFKSRRARVLVATDVAGRGIDVPDVGLVVVYEMPETIEQYTHRIGRTGRAGKQGTAVAFLTYANTPIFYDLKQLLIETNNKVPKALAQHEASKQRGGKEADLSEQHIIH